MEAQKQKSWFGRNWPWIIPVGGCLTVILLFVFGIGAIFFGVSKVMKNSAPFEHAIQLAENNPEVVRYLGNNIETYGIFSGNVSLNNDDIDVDVKTSIKGTKGKGSLLIKGEKLDGEWTYEKLYVLIKDTNEKIHLLDKTLEGI